MKVIKTFVDKKTKNLYQVGSEYNGDRVDELQSAGLLESKPGGDLEKAPEKEPEKEPEKKDKKKSKKDGSKKGDK